MINRAQPTPPSAVAVRVCFGGRGMWEVMLPDQRTRQRCETLDDARKAAYVQAANRRPCELIVCDAYNRVLHREFVTRRGELESERPLVGASPSAVS